MQLRLNSTLRARFGHRVVPVSLAAASSVQEVMNLLQREMPELYGALMDEDGHLQENVAIFHNGRNILLQQGLNTQLSAGDTLDCFPKMGIQRAFASG